MDTTTAQLEAAVHIGAESEEVSPFKQSATEVKGTQGALLHTVSLLSTH